MNTWQRGNDGLCPHCGLLVNFRNPDEITSARGFPHATNLAVKDVEGNKYIMTSACPSCKKVIVYGVFYQGKNSEDVLLYPQFSIRAVSEDVPIDIAEDFLEASQVLVVSEKASAALSRRCLQNVLHDNGIKDRDLSKEIDNAIPTLPSYIAENVDAIRNIGNFAAHPIKSDSSGTIVEVEKGEAEWLLDVLELLFDHYYVVPKKAKEKREKLDKKLDDAGKPKMKST